ncbi:hypothetical protein Arub01_41130 [Actinomadura rubrobrunea]|uniref:Uncharacterized protein n=1 Tax=Actinomadura rubrobrunea TaxID=115335 RepID=A0A9W6UW72_9ACTN|nr:hypothetical protein [Actinomadura rubrobrunea]GLW65869.1 hypothetical protein Arub01_41130 [Actinomadura rubrobrunea]
MPTRTSGRRPSPSVPGRARAAACAAVAVLAAAGCSDSDESPPDARAPSAAAVPTTSAADGTRIAACADGNCEILVTGPVEIDVGGHGGLRKLSVVKVAPTGLSFTATADGGGGGTGTLEPGCTLRFYENGQSSACVAGGSPPPLERQKGVLAMRVTAAGRDGVVLRLASGGIGPPPASLAPRITPPRIEPPRIEPPRIEPPRIEIPTPDPP